MRVDVTVSGVGHPEHCLVPPGVLAAADLVPGQQFRLSVDGAPALFTAREGAGDCLRVNSAGRDRLGVTDGYTGSATGADGGETTGGTAVEGFRATLDARVVGDGDAETALEDGGFVERLRDDGSGDLVALAPHGGHVEFATAEQAGYLAELAGGVAWRCLGFWPGGGAFDRWHVTSNDLHPDSFPGLSTIAGRGFDRAVAFHGWGRDGVGVGGLAPRAVRARVRDAVADALPGEVEVFLVEGSCDGSSPENVVNRLAADGGVQLEQALDVRREHGPAVVEAVSGVLGRDR